MISFKSVLLMIFGKEPCSEACSLFYIKIGQFKKLFEQLLFLWLFKKLKIGIFNINIEKQ